VSWIIFFFLYLFWKNYWTLQIFMQTIQAINNAGYTGKGAYMANLSDSVERAHLQSRILIESLPYLREYHGETVVIKYGGHAMTDENLKLAFARNISLLKLVGIHPVVVHGGGPQINRMLNKLEIQSEFRQGHRVTDKATMDVVEMVLVGSVNKSVVNLINKTGARAVGLSGKDGLLLEAQKLAMTISRGEEQPPEIIDLGNVGEVTHVNAHLLTSLISDDFVPVIAPVGVDTDGQTYNINADSVAGAVAGALKAKRLLMLTDVAGILNKNGQLIEHINTVDADILLADGTISGGMIPKISCCLNAIKNGVDKVTIVDGRVENCLLLELLTDQGIGTEIVY
jgi:acetylglutamate kinase